MKEYDRDCLDRDTRCNDCHWIGRLGELIGADVLRCPKCRSASIGYYIAEQTETVQ